MLRLVAICPGFFLNNKNKNSILYLEWRSANRFIFSFQTYKDDMYTRNQRVINAAYAQPQIHNSPSASAGNKIFGLDFLMYLELITILSIATKYRHFWYLVGQVELAARVSYPRGL